MPHGDGIGEGGSPRFEAAWERYLRAEQRAEGWLALEDVAPDGTQGGGRRYRCVAEGCGREVLVVRDSRDASLGDPPACHGLKMRPVGSPIPNKIPPVG